MDNVTHGLWGLGIYGSWAAIAHPNPETGLAAGVCVAAILGSEAPDFDYVIRWLFGPVAYLRQHRAVSHSLPMWFLWPLLISLALSIWWPGHLGLLYLVSFLGVIIHVGLDLLTTYGTQALWPFSKRRWAFDALFIVDIVILLAGALGVILHVSGVWTTAHATLVMGSIVLVYLAVRCVQAGLLYERVRKAFPAGWHVSATPGPLPWMWNFVAQREAEIIAGKVTLSGEVQGDIHWVQDSDRDETALSFAIRFSRVGSVFYWFARHFIWAQVHEGNRIRISFADVTYRFRKTLPFTGYVVLEPRPGGRYEVLEESIHGQEADFEALLKDAVMAEMGSAVMANTAPEKE